MSALKRLPIDQYQRYRLVADLAGRMRRGERPLRVLDIGGRTGLLRRFMPTDRVIAVDREAIEDPRDLILGDGARLPFADRAFDLVCAFDTLEHVPPAARDAFVDECLRVCGRHVVLIGPWAGSRIARAEGELRSFLLDKLKLEHRYLEEHHVHGLPSRRRVTARMERAGARVLSIGQGNLQRWLALMCLEIYLEADADLRPFAPQLYEFYNASLYATDNRPPVYRHALVAAVGGAELPDVEGIFEEEQEPPELFEALNRFLPDLMAFDRAKGEWREERRRFERTVSELREELGAHRELKAELQAELADQRRAALVVTGLREQELADRAAVAEHVRELEGELRKMAATAEQLEASRVATQAELDAVIADRETIRATLEGVAAERDAVRADRDAVDADRQAIAAHRSEVEQERDHAVRARDFAMDERNRVVGEHEHAAARFGAQLTDIDRDRIALRERADHLERTLASERERLSRFDHARLAAIEQQLAALNEAHTALRQERDLLAHELDVANRERVTLRPRMAELEERSALQRASILELRGALRELIGAATQELGAVLTPAQRTMLGLEDLRRVKSGASAEPLGVVPDLRKARQRRRRRGRGGRRRR